MTNMMYLFIGFLLGGLSMVAISWIIGNATEKGRRLKKQDAELLKYYKDFK